MFAAVVIIRPATEIALFASFITKANHKLEGTVDKAILNKNNFRQNKKKSCYRPMLSLKSFTVLMVPRTTIWVDSQSTQKISLWDPEERYFGFSGIGIMLEAKMT